MEHTVVVFWVSIVIFVVAALGLIIWRDELAHVQAMLLGARMHAGCAVAEAVALLLLALIFFLGIRSGAFG